MPELITSPSNPKVKRLLALQQKSSERRERGLFVVEGRRELQHCIDAGFEVDTVFVCPALLSSASAVETAAAPENRSHPRLRKREGPADEVSGRGPAQPDVSRGWLPPARSGM
jgi:tRNA G18 (ribose-2'-O)-methylase SpoU